MGYLMMTRAGMLRIAGLVGEVGDTLEALIKWGKQKSDSSWITIQVKAEASNLSFLRA